MHHADSYNAVTLCQHQYVIHQPLAVKVTPSASKIAPALNAIHYILRAPVLDCKADDWYPQTLIRRSFTMYCDILPASQIRQQLLLQLLLMRSNCVPCCAFVSAEIRDNGRKCGYELIARGRKAKPSFEVVAGVEIMAERAKSLLDGLRSVENRYMGTVDLYLESALRPLKTYKCVTDFIP